MSAIIECQLSAIIECQLSAIIECQLSAILDCQATHCAAFHNLFVKRNDNIDIVIVDVKGFFPISGDNLWDSVPRLLNIFQIA